MECWPKCTAQSDLSAKTISPRHHVTRTVILPRRWSKKSIRSQQPSLLPIPCRPIRGTIAKIPACPGPPDFVDRRMEKDQGRDSRGTGAMIKAGMEINTATTGMWPMAAIRGVFAVLERIHI